MLSERQQRVLEALKQLEDCYRDWGMMRDASTPYEGNYDPAAPLVAAAWVEYQNIWNTMVDEDGPWELDEDAARFVKGAM